MARVPTVGGQSVKLRDVAGPRSSPDMFGASLGGAIADTGAALTKLGVEQWRKESLTRAADATLEYDRKQNDILAKLQQNKLAGAQEARVAADAELAAAREEMLGRLSDNQYAQTEFMRSADRYDTSFKKSADDFVLSQSFQNTTTTLKAGAEAAAERLKLDPTNPDMLAELQQKTIELGAHQGYSPGVIAQQRDMVVGNTLADAVTNRIKIGQVSGAKQLYEQNKQRIPADQRADIERQLGASDDLAAALSASDAAWSGARTTFDPKTGTADGHDFGTAMKALKAAYDKGEISASVFQKAESNLVKLDAQQQKIVSDIHNRLSDSAANLVSEIDKMTIPTDIPRSKAVEVLFDKWKLDNNEAWKTMPMPQRTAIEKQFKQEQYDPAVVNRLMEMAPEELMRVNLPLARADLGRYYDAVQKKQEKLLNGDYDTHVDQQVNSLLRNSLPLVAAKYGIDLTPDKPDVRLETAKAYARGMITQVMGAGKVVDERTAMKLLDESIQAQKMDSRKGALMREIPRSLTPADATKFTAAEPGTKEYEDNTYTLMNWATQVYSGWAPLRRAQYDRALAAQAGISVEKLGEFRSALATVITDPIDRDRRIADMRRLQQVAAEQQATRESMGSATGGRIGTTTTKITDPLAFAYFDPVVGGAFGVGR